MSWDPAKLPLKDFYNGYFNTPLANKTNNPFEWIALKDEYTNKVELIKFCKLNNPALFNQTSIQTILTKIIYGKIVHDVSNLLNLYCYFEIILEKPKLDLIWSELKNEILTSQNIYICNGIYSHDILKKYFIIGLLLKKIKYEEINPNIIRILTLELHEIHKSYKLLLYYAKTSNCLNKPKIYSTHKYTPYYTQQHVTQTYGMTSIGIFIEDICQKENISQTVAMQKYDFLKKSVEPQRLSSFTECSLEHQKIIDYLKNLDYSHMENFIKKIKIDVLSN